MTWNVGQLVRLRNGPHRDRFANVLEVDDDRICVVLRDVDERLADGRRRTIAVTDTDIEPFEASTDTMYLNPWSLQMRDLVEVRSGRNEGARGRLYRPPEGFPGRFSIHVAGDTDGQREFVYEAMLNLKPITDRDPSPPPSLPPSSSEPPLTPDQRILRVLIDDAASDSPLSARELAAEARCNGKNLLRGRAVFEHPDLVEAVREGATSLRDAAAEAGRRTGSETVEADEAEVEV